ncbi:hypothetical protein, partial [Nocardia ninae]|uniref:hypothetical protein n=1 Tax=Nocardia ninae TaxID=356145 RepID=UPI0039F06E81
MAATIAERSRRITLDTVDFGSIRHLPFGRAATIMFCTEGTGGQVIDHFSNGRCQRGADAYDYALPFLHGPSPGISPSTGPHYRCSLVSSS